MIHDKPVSQNLLSYRRCSRKENSKDSQTGRIGGDPPPPNFRPHLAIRTLTLSLAKGKREDLFLHIRSHPLSGKHVRNPAKQIRVWVAAVAGLRELLPDRRIRPL